MKKNIMYLRLYFMIIISIVPIIIPASALAVDADFYGANDIVFYNPDGCSTTASQPDTGNPNMPYELPATSGFTGYESAINKRGKFVAAEEWVTWSELAAKSSQDHRDYYITMRWKYGKWLWRGATRGAIDEKQFAWFAKSPRIVLVTNKRNGKSIYAAALEAGPQGYAGAKGSASDNGWKDPQDGTPVDYTGRVSGLSPKAYKAIDAKQGENGKGDILTYQWASDQKAKPGPTTAAGPSKSSISSVKVSGKIDLKKSDKLEKIFQLLINGGLNAVQASAVMGNMYAESSFRSDAVEEGNNIGFGLAQWSFGRRDNLEAYAKKKGLPASDVGLQIEFLLKEYNDGYKKGLDKTAFKNATNIAEATKAWMMKFERPAMKPPNDPARLNSKRIPAAETIYNFYSSLAPGGTSDVKGDCDANSSDNGIVAGDIVSTAISFALKKPATNGMNKDSDAVPAYIDALKKYNNSADSADCGIFVATVMIASGADTKYPNVGTANQLRYVKEQKDKYKIINSPKRSDLQPGDILLYNTGTHGHTQIYTGETPYPIVDASLNQRVPSVRTEGHLKYMLGISGLIIARLIK